MYSDDSLKRGTVTFKKIYPKSRTVSVKEAKLGKGGVSAARLMRKLKFRSQFESNIARKLVERGISFEYEKERVVYIPKPRTYTPDFYFPDTDVYVETKGHLDKGDRVKMLLVKEQNPDLDIRFVFIRASNKIYKGSKTTYGDWATKHGFQWAEGSIPEEWCRNER